jgi:ribokinase
LKVSDHDALNVVVVGTPAMDLMAKVKALPHTDEMAIAERYGPYAGGAGANVAVGAARLGCRVGFLGTLGDDEYGRLLLHAFEGEGIDTRGVRIAKGKSSPSCFIAVGPRGERMIFALGGEALLEEVDELGILLLRGIRALYVTDVPIRVAAAAMTAVREEGGFVFLNPGGLLISGGLEPMRPLLARADAVVISQAEGSRLFTKETREQAARLMAADGPGVVVMTLGSEGALVLHNNKISKVKAYEVQDVVDTTGAGDAFAAGLIAGFIEGLDWYQAARLGCAVAAIKIRHFGARSGLPTRRQVDDIVQFRQGGAS